MAPSTSISIIVCIVCCSAGRPTDGHYPVPPVSQDHARYSSVYSVMADNDLVLRRAAEIFL